MKDFIEHWSSNWLAAIKQYLNLVHDPIKEDLYIEEHKRG